jgi:endoglucanase
MSFRAAALILVFSILALPTYATNYSTYTISPASYPNLCIAPSGSSDGSSLIITSCDTSSDIVWTMKGDQLQNTATNLCADVTGGGEWSGNTMQVWECFDDNQHQSFSSSTGNSGLIKWSGKKMCLDLTDGLGVDGNKVQIWSCGNSNVNQQWIFTEAEEVDDDCGGCFDVL